MLVRGLNLLTAVVLLGFLVDSQSIVAQGDNRHGESKYANRSAMASGDWYKIGLSATGVYKLTYNDLKSLGLDLANLDPRTLRVYHNGGGVLPELNAEARYDDLVEIPISVYGESDGKFDPNDYVLFYGRGPLCWKYNAQKSVYEHNPNPYDDYSYAYVVTGLGNGKRIAEAASVSGNSDETVSEFLDYQVHEAKDYNIHCIGRTFYGDILEGTSTQSYSFTFPNALTSRHLVLNTSLAGRNLTPAYFEVYVDEVKKATYSIENITEINGYTYAHSAGGRVEAFPKGETVSVRLRHLSSSTTTSTGYVDYLALNVWRALAFSGPQMRFGKPDAINNKVYEYRMSGANAQVQVWDVTDPVAPQKMKCQLSGTTCSFKAAGHANGEFVAFDGSGFHAATAIGKTDNQNLHGVRNMDYVIVTYPDFISQAERLKSIHEWYSPNLNVFITTPELIYNEFSCGAKDISAIRDFCRMLYLDSNSNHRIKYLLLLGDCSFDHKNRSGVVDFVPSFETVNSLSMDDAFVTDDFFGCFDENEGNIGKSLADIGIGRFPVSTLEQATQMVDKIERYIARDESTMRPWRNVFTFFTDDEDSFTNSAEKFVKRLDEVGGENVVVDKIYLGAYPQESSPGGEICPQMNAAINNRMEKGTLVLTYVGHGGEVQLADEKILQRKDVDSWRNAPMCPLMITGTCEFSRYDDHTRTSLGEYAFLNPYGGMVAMFTTSRITQGGNNNDFINGILDNLFRCRDEETLTLGDVYRLAKKNGNYLEKRYVFFGDPALRLTYPKWTVETVGINGKMGFVQDSIQINDTTWQTYTICLDTISALQPVEIEGVVKDGNGNIAEGFNGVVHVTVYDKEEELVATNTTPGGVVTHKPFKLRNSIIFNGKTEVKNGRFVLNFIVPRDISYRYGKGMISYYATDYNIDATGKCEDFIIGGFYDNAVADNDPPEIRLFIDDTLFVSGSFTGENPTLLAYVEDESGINTTGAGIGHDITATLVGSDRISYCLNDYFSANTDDPGKGVINFKMQKLADGDYTLTLKVWDIYNNSNTATIDFTVVNSAGMCIENPSCAPNPVTDEAAFYFEHNQIGNNLNVQIDIFDVMGRWVTRISEVVAGTSARTTPIRWNGRGTNGQILKNGVYVYRIVATNDKGETATVVSKMVLSN